MKSMKSFFLLMLFGPMTLTNAACVSNIGDECTENSDCCTGFCYIGKCIEEPCNLMGLCLNNLPCWNLDDCTTCPCQRVGHCLSRPDPSCTSNNCTCTKWSDCTSGCCSNGICVEDPKRTKCNSCCLTRCPMNSRCALQQIFCKRAPCILPAVCVVDPDPRFPDSYLKCPEGLQLQFRAECSPREEKCGICVITTPGIGGFENAL